MSSEVHELRNQQSNREQNTDTMDKAIALLQQHKQEWTTVSVAQKIGYLKQLTYNTGKVAEEWAKAGCAAKGIPENSPLAGEEWDSGPWSMLYALKRYSETLAAIEKTGYPNLKPEAVHVRRDGQVVVDVFPQSIYDKLLFNGITAKVWMQRGVTKENLRETMGVWYRQKEHTGKVALVLGAGNIASIAPLDVLYKLLAEGQTVLLKMNPVNDYLGPIFEKIFAPLIRDGFVQLAYGGVEAGKYLCAHSGIEEIHITGSAGTHDAIVFGAGEEQVTRKAHNDPANLRRITSELGNVSPTIVVPGPWSEADLRFQAEHIVTQKMHNGGFNCIASQVLILPQQWDKTEKLLQAIKDVVKTTPLRAAYYPGARQRFTAAQAAHPDMEILETTQDSVPRAMIHQKDYTQINDFCFQTEAFGSVLTETRLPGEDAASYIKNAVEFCNSVLWGTLGANIIIHPQTIKALNTQFDDAVATLKYGTIAINAWTGVGFLLTQAPWGAYPGHTLSDIRSGIGVVHNSLLFDKTEKTVIQAPFYPYPRSFANGAFTIFPKPPWFVTHKHAADLGKKLVQFELRPSIGKLPAIFIDALRS